MKNALAQIAASTIAHTSSIAEISSSESPSSSRAPIQNPSDSTMTENRAVTAPVPHSADAADYEPLLFELPSRIEETPVVPVEASVEILDIPIKKNSRGPRRISTHDAEQILDSVLDALPEPKLPGQGRSRVSRRASSAGTVRTTASGGTENPGPSTGS